MSQANASARKRRAPAPVVAPPGSSTNTPQFSQNSAQQQQQPQTPSSGLTLPQVILLVDKRLTTLEKFMNTTNTFIETQKNMQPSVTVESTPESDENLSSEQLDGIIEEFNSRYAMLAEEIANLKDMLLKLSSYTMEVNKKLFEQHILHLCTSNPPTLSTDLTNKGNSYHALEKCEGANTPTIIKNSNANDFSHCEEEQLFVLPSSENSTETLSEENSSNIITFMSEE